MHPKEQIMADLKTAMKSGDKDKRDTLRVLSSAFKQYEIDNRKDISEDDALKILQKEAKRREESIAELEGAGRDSSQEIYELNLIQSYLPEQLDRDTLVPMVQKAIEESGAQTPKDMGDVMKILMPQIKGRADGKLVNEIVREQLA